MLNESANSVKWLSGRLGLAAPEASPCRRTWDRVKTAMRAESQHMMTTQDWPSDFWICKGAEPLPIGVVPTWTPPDEIDEWPALPDRLASVQYLRARPTNHTEFERVLGSATGEADTDNDAALADFYRLINSVSGRGSVALVQTEHVRAWLAAAVGRLLVGLVLSPQSPHELLVAEGQRRMLLPRRLITRNSPSLYYGFQFAEGELALLYNCQPTSLGHPPTLVCASVKATSG
jgi:hypothetical protein